MTNEPGRDQSIENEPAATAAGSLFGALGRRAVRAARGVGKGARQQRPAAERAAREAGEQLRRAAEAARPRAEQLARQAKDAAEAARPRVERAAHDAAGQARDYTREHGDDIRRAAGRAARGAARGLTPRPLRPAVEAFEEELRSSEQSTPDEAAATATDDAEQPDAEQPDAGQPPR